MPAVTNPNIGLILDKPPIDIPTRGLQDGLNFRIKNGTIESRNLGWSEFATTNHWTLNGAVRLIDNFFPRDGVERLIFGTEQDLYVYDPATDTVRYITPIKTYSGNIAYVNGSPTLTGTGTTFLTDGPKPGDQVVLSLVAADQTNPSLNTSIGWYTVLAVPDDTHITLTTNVTATSNPTGSITVRLCFTGEEQTVWSVDTFINDGATGDDLWFATNGIEPIVTWNGSDNTATSHPELLFTAAVVTTYSNMMIYGNIVQGGNPLPTSIINSDPGYPLQAGALGVSLSEQFVVHSGTDPILNMLPIGDYLVIYAERTIIPTQFVGDPLIFVFRVAISGVGPISADAIADFGDFHEFIGADAGYLFDGVTLKETNAHVWRSILRQADPARRHQVFGSFDEEQGDLIWSIPGNTDPTVGEIGTPAVFAYVEHYLEDAGQAIDGSPFSKRQFPFTITGFYERKIGFTWAMGGLTNWDAFNYRWDDQNFQSNFPLNLAGDINGKVWIVSNAQTGAGAVLPSYVRTGRMPLRSGRERDLLTRIYPYATAEPYNLEVTLFMSDFVSAAMQTKGMALFDMNMVPDHHFVTFYRRGRTMEFQFGSSGGNPWTLEGWDYDTRNGGTR